MVEEFEPVRSKRGSGAIERVPLFIIEEPDGTDTVYDVPVEVPPHITMAMLRDLADDVPFNAAVAKAMRAVLGAEAMDVLAEPGAVDKPELEQIMGILERMVLAAQEDTVGKRRPVPRR